MRTTIEYQDFVKKANKLIGEEKRERIVENLGNTPGLGKSVQGFGGLHRYDVLAPTPKGNVSYSIYYHPGSHRLPVSIIGIFKKKEKQVLEKILEILIYSQSGPLVP